MNRTLSPLVSLYWRETPHNRAARAVLLLLAGVCLLAVSAQVKVPYYPVPQTLQTLAVLLLPFLFGARPAVAAVVSYLALGAAGAPVFAAGGGWAVFTGPTGGFLLGFLLAVLWLAWCWRRGWLHGALRLLLCLSVADALIFLCGLPWLALALASWQQAWTAGALPFLLGDMSKVALTTALVVLAQRRQA